MEEKTIPDFKALLQTLQNRHYKQQAWGNMLKLPMENWELYGSSIEDYLRAAEVKSQQPGTPTMQTIEGIQNSRGTFIAEIIHFLLLHDREDTIHTILQNLSTDTLTHLLPFILRTLDFRSAKEFNKFLTASLSRLCLVWQVVTHYPEFSKYQSLIETYLKRNWSKLEDYAYGWLLESPDGCNAIEIVVRLLRTPEERAQFIHKLSLQFQSYPKSFSPLRNVLLGNPPALQFWVPRAIARVNEAKDPPTLFASIVDNYLILPEIVAAKREAWPSIKKTILTYTAQAIENSTCRDLLDAKTLCENKIQPKLEALFDYEVKNLEYMLQNCPPDTVAEVVNNRDEWKFNPPGTIHKHKVLDRCETDREIMIQDLQNGIPFAKLSAESKRILWDSAQRQKSNFSLFATLYQEVLTAIVLHKMSPFLEFLFEANLYPQMKDAIMYVHQTIQKEEANTNRELSRTDEEIKREERQYRESKEEVEELEAATHRLKQQRERIWDDFRDKMIHAFASLLVSVPDSWRTQLHGKVRMLTDRKLAAEVCHKENKRYNQCMQEISKDTNFKELMSDWDKEDPEHFAQTLVRNQYLLQKCPNAWGSYAGESNNIENFNVLPSTGDTISELPPYLMSPWLENPSPHPDCYNQHAIALDLLKNALSGRTEGQREYPMPWGEFGYLGSKPDEKKRYLSYHISKQPIPESEIEKAFKIGLPFPFIRGKKDLSPLQRWYQLVLNIARESKKGVSAQTDEPVKHYQRFLNNFVVQFPASKHAQVRELVDAHIKTLKSALLRNFGDVRDTIGQFISNLQEI
jgi:hypothetical protein